nr:zinc finger, CCHC-type [Tanacetum cinerariifolium]
MTRQESYGCPERWPAIWEDSRGCLGSLDVEIRKRKLVIRLKGVVIRLKLKSIPPAPVSLAGQQVAPEILAAHAAWVKGSKKIAGLTLMTMEPDIQRNMENLHAHKLLLELKTLFAQLS